VHAFVSSRLDYCNYLLYDISDGLLKRLQAVQNSAARDVTSTRKFDYITPVLRDLHWLPIRQQILFKLAMIVQFSRQSQLQEAEILISSPIPSLAFWDLVYHSQSVKNCRDMTDFESDFRIRWIPSLFHKSESDGFADLFCNGFGFDFHFQF